MKTVAWAIAYCASGRPMWSSAWAAATATCSARGSAFPTSSDALMIRRRTMNLGSSPAAIIAAEPVERRVGVVAAEALDERGHGVVVPVAGAVIGEDALLGRRLDVLEAWGDAPLLVADVLALGERGRALEHVEGRARVATGEADQVIEGVLGERHATIGTESAGEAALFVFERPADDGRHVVIAEWLESPDAHPGQERGVDLEVRVLGRRADERDRAVLDMGEQRVLLGLVESMDLVEEQHGPRAVEGEPVLCLGDQRSHVRDAGHDRRDRREVRADLPGEQPREAGLAGPGRSPEDEAGEVAAGDAPAQGPALADEVVLADELVEAARPHPRGERLTLGRWLEEGLGTGTDRAPGSGHVPMVARWACGTGLRRPAAEAALDQRAKGPMPVAWITTHSTISRATIDPPIMAIRRTSRAT